MLTLDTRLPTPYGWTTVQNLMPGTSVFDEQGYPVFVSSVGGVTYETVYRVGFTNKRCERGAVFMTESQGLRTCHRDALQKFTNRTGVKMFPSDWAEHDAKQWSLSDVKDTYEQIEASTGARKLMHVIPSTFPLVLPNSDAGGFVTPYIMGLATQIYDRHTGLLTCKERMWDWYEKQFVAGGFDDLERTRKRWKRWQPEDDVTFSSPRLSRELHRYADCREGLIPAQYLRGSAQQRMDLLTGLLDISMDDINTHGDTNAKKDKDSSVMVWCGRRPRLAEQVTELIRTLGYAATTRHHKKANSYTVSYTPIENPYRYPKFRAQLPDLTRLTRNTFQRFSWRVQSVEEAGRQRVRSFEVTSPSGLVSVSDLFLPLEAGK